jgi:hypothetical protein
MHMHRDSLIPIIAALIFISLTTAPSYGISFSFDAGGGSGAITTTSSYNLDRSSSLIESTEIREGELRQCS